MPQPRNLGDILRLPALQHRLAYVDLRDPRRPYAASAAELDQLIGRIAGGLIARGVHRGERVGILSENRLEFVASYLAIMRIGAVAVPINHKLPASIVAHVFRDSGIVLALADAAREALVPAGVPIVRFGADSPGSFDSLLRHGSVATVVPDDREIAEILYTSGSTGVPKGVPLTHRGQLWALAKYCPPIAADGAGSSTLVTAPLYHMNGLFFTTVALANRVTVISQPRFDAASYLQTVARYRCDVLSGIPTMFAMMVRERELAARLDFGCVREISIGSAPLTDTLLAKVKRLFPHALVKNGFGTTEVGPAVFGPHPEGRPTPPLSLGYPFPDVKWELADGPSDGEGVLAVRTPALTEGYLNLPEVTAQKMRDGWYVTGDIMRRDAHGFFYFVGRADDMFVCGGENIYPSEIEMMLERHAHVHQAAVVPAPDDIKGHVPVAFIVPLGATALTEEEIRRYALANGPAYAHPRLVVFREQLPVAGTHKIDRASLAAEAARLAREMGRTTLAAATRGAGT